MIKIIDNVLNLYKTLYLYENILKHGKFSYGEKDHPKSEPVGMICDMEPYHYDKLKIDIFEHFSEVSNLKLQRAYVNLFRPYDNPYFHCDNLVDHEILTVLLYICPQYDIDQGGETQFIVDNEIKGVFPKAGRAILFDGSILHRATSFRNKPRITIALKYFKNSV